MTDYSPKITHNTPGTRNVAEPHAAPVVGDGKLTIHGPVYITEVPKSYLEVKHDLEMENARLRAEVAELRKVIGDFAHFVWERAIDDEMFERAEKLACRYPKADSAKEAPDND